jgi:hypothetical protein
LPPSDRTYDYTFDNIFKSTVTTHEVYERAAEGLVWSCMDGYNGIDYYYYYYYYTPVLTIDDKTNSLLLVLLSTNHSYTVCIWPNGLWQDLHHQG